MRRPQITPGPQRKPGQQQGRRSAVLLKRRLIEEQRQDLLAELDHAWSDRTFEQAASAIGSARRRFIVGAAQSFTYASLRAMELSAGLANVTLIDGTIVRPLDILSDVRSTDVLVACSLSRYRRYTFDVVAPFRESGGTVVLITDSPTAPLVALAIHILATLTTASAKGAARRQLERDRLSQDLGLLPGQLRGLPQTLLMQPDASSTPHLCPVGTHSAARARAKSLVWSRVAVTHLPIFHAAG